VSPFPLLKTETDTTSYLFRVPEDRQTNPVILSAIRHRKTRLDFNSIQLSISSDVDSRAAAQNIPNTLWGLEGSLIISENAEN
jgi:hypothetical protein